MPVSEKLIEQAREANEEYKHSRLKFNRAKRKRAQAVAKLNAAGMSLREIATLLNIHFTRVRQLISEAEQPPIKPKIVKRRAYRILVRKADSDVWHWCKACSTYPSTPVARRVLAVGKRPSGGELCNECRAKEKAGDCH